MSLRSYSCPTGTMLTLSLAVSAITFIVRLLPPSLISFEEVSLHISDHLCAFQLRFCSANPKDFIEVKFDTSTVDNLQGLHCYMNTLVNNNDDL